MTTQSLDWAWRIHRNAPRELGVCEKDADGTPKPGGLILRGCPHCGKVQTRETYCRGFWAEEVTLVTDYLCTGVQKCTCGKWSVWYG
jgi:hypothetical protein